MRGKAVSNYFETIKATNQTVALIPSVWETQPTYEKMDRHILSRYLQALNDALHGGRRVLLYALSCGAPTGSTAITPLVEGDGCSYKP